jgi:hypothetical protein
MKLNFWQWVGLIVFLIALAVVVWKGMSGAQHPSEPATPAPAVAPTTQT